MQNTPAKLILDTENIMFDCPFLKPKTRISFVFINI